MATMKLTQTWTQNQFLYPEEDACSTGSDWLCSDNTPLDRLNGLVGYWNLNEGLGATAEDISGNDNHGTLVADTLMGGSISWATGKYETGVYFFQPIGGDWSHINVPHDTSLDITDNWTISFWMKVTNSVSSKDIVISKAANDTGYQQPFQIYIDSATGQLMLIVGDGVSDYATASAGTKSVLDAQWYFVTAYRNHQTIGIMLNAGQHEGTGDKLLTSYVTNTSPLKIGAPDDSVTSGFNGTLDEVRIYNRVLSQSELDLIYNLQADEVGLESKCEPYKNLGGTDDYIYTNISLPTDEVGAFLVKMQTLAGIGTISKINYVLFKGAASLEYAGDAGYLYPLLSTASECTLKDIDDTWNVYSNKSNYTTVFVTNPSTGSEWEVSDFLNLYCGAWGKMSQRRTALHTHQTLRPISNGRFAQHYTNIAGKTNWEQVDEEISDGDATQNVNAFYASGDGYPNDFEKTDTFNITTFTPEATTNLNIDSVTIYCSYKSHYSYKGKISFLIGYKDIDTTYPQAVRTWEMPMTWTLSNKTWTQNPRTSLDWTLSDINNLQVGYWTHCIYRHAYYGVKVTQCYAVVSYSCDIPVAYNAIRLHDLHLTVNYDTSVQATLNRPESFSFDHARNVKKLNFWNGEREVYDDGRTSKSLVLEGREFYEWSGQKILAVRDMGKRHQPITLSDLGDDARVNFLLGKYIIKSFGWKEISRKPEHFSWILELERDE